MSISNDYLLSEAREFLAQAEAHPAVKAYRQSLPLSRIWVENEPLKLEYLNGEKATSWQAMMQLQTRLFVHSPSAREAQLAVRWYLAQTGYVGPQASEHAPEDSVVRMANGRRYWHDDFRHWMTFHRLLDKLDGSDPNHPLSPQSRKGVVVELGAGCGNLARIVRRERDVKYVIIDLPDTLVFSYMFLKANFPDATFDQVGEIMEGWRLAADFTFIPVGLETVLHGQRIDLFINTASLGEMRRETVRHWFDFVQRRTDTRHILSVNRFMNVIRPGSHDWRIEDNGHAFMFDEQWKVLDWELDPHFLRCPWQNRHARQLLIIAQRSEGLPDYDAEDFGAAACGSWTQGPHEMSVQAPPLSPDFTKNGTLYKIWNALRHGDRLARGLFLEYCEFLNRGLTEQRFEDELQISRETKAFHEKLP